MVAGAEWYFGAYLAQCLLGRRSMLEQGCPKSLRGCLADRFSFPAEILSDFGCYHTVFGQPIRSYHIPYHTLPSYPTLSLPLVSTATAKQRE